MEPPGPLLLPLYILLAYILSFLSLALDLLGLSDLVADDPVPSSFSPRHDNFIRQHLTAAGDDDETASAATVRLTRCRLRPATLVRELLPVSIFADEAETDGAAAESCCCTVCMCKLRRWDEVRRPQGCRYVFHRQCLDPWVDLGHRTCPLCRAPLVPAEAAGLGGTCESTVDRAWYDYIVDDDGDELESLGFYSLGDPSDVPSSIPSFLLAPQNHAADTFSVAG